MILLEKGNPFMCIKDAHWGERNYNKDEREEGEHKESIKSDTRVSELNPTP